MNQGASGAALRDVNRSALLHVLVVHGPQSRAELSRRLGVRAGTVTALVRGLVDSGLVAPVDTAASQGGRPAELVGLVGDAAVALGVKVAGDHLTVVAATLGGRVVRSRTTEFDPAQPLLHLADELAADVAELGAESLLLGIGLGLPGFEDPYGSGVVQAPLLGWRNLPLADHLSRTLHVPVLVDNDVNTLAVAEHLYGVSKGVANSVTITLGRGVGMGVVIGGELYRGARGAAGEFGHVRVVDDGETCACGKRGCLETVAAEPGMLRRARATGVVGADASFDDLLGAAQEGDNAAVALFDDTGRVLGRAAAAVSVVLDPELIVVGGEGTRAWHLLAGSFREQLDRDGFPVRNGPLPVQVVGWDDSRWALGAASLVLRAPLVTPLHEHPTIDMIRARLDAGFRAPLARQESSGGSGGWSA